MSLSELAQSDARAILSADGETATLTAPESLGGAAYVVPCLLFRRGMTRDAEGLAIISEASSISVSIAELAAAGITDPETLKAKGWTASLLGVSYRLDAAPIDYTHGLITLILKRAA